MSSKNKKITPADVARDLGICVELVRLCIREGKFPFAVAVKVNERYSYVIFPELYRRYIAGERDYDVP